MNKNINFFFLCPVPEEEKPLTTYLTLKQDSGIRWTTFGQKKYEKKLFSLFFFFFCGISFLRLFPTLCRFSFSFSLSTNWLSFFSLLDPNYFLDWIVTTSLFALIFLFLLVGKLCFRWKDLEKKFLAKEIIYEEGSWYGGQIWQKPRVIQKNDQFICQQKVTPIVQRIQRTLLTLSSLLFLLFFLLEFIL